MSRWMLQSVSVSLSAVVLLAGQESVVPKADAVARRCAIAGMVTEAAGGVPIQDVLVSVSGPGPQVTAMTDSAGRYTFKDLPPGDVRVSVRKDGYGRGPSGNSAPFKYLRLAAGQQLAKVDFHLKKEAVLGGRVLDSNKNPVVGADVSVYGLGFSHGQRLLWSRATTQSNDLGEYRVLGLTEGAWYLGALTNSRRISVRTSSTKTEPKARSADVRVFFPNSFSIDSSEPVYLRAGEERTNVDLVLPRGMTFCVTASVGAEGILGKRLVVLTEYSPGWHHTIASRLLAAPSEIELCGIPPGAYYLDVRVLDGNGGYSALGRADFEVIDRHVDLGTLHATAGMTIAGKLIVADGEHEVFPPGGIRVGLEPKDRMTYVGENAAVSVRGPGDFQLPRVFDGLYWLIVRGLPRDCYVKEATMGGMDALRARVRAGSGDLRVVLGVDGASVSGKVVDKDGQALADAVAVLAPAALPSVGLPDVIHTQITDQDGEFQFANIAPGEYRLLAFTELALGEGENPDFLRRYLTKAFDLDLQPRETKRVTLTVLPTP